MEAVVHLRKGSPQESASIGALWFASRLSTSPEERAVTEADLLARCAAEMAGRWDVTVAEGGRELLGFIALVREENRVDQLFVAPRAQGRGIGARLLAVAKDRFKDGFWFSVQAANRRARAFYEREGLSLQGETVGGRLIFAYSP